MVTFSTSTTVAYVHYAMENCLDLAIRTEGAVGNVAPTIDKNAACCALGIYAEYVLGCYALRGDVRFLQGDTIAALSLFIAFG